jgi:oligopeptide/dipeptide ABC transporter ATP-binding protein
LTARGLCKRFAGGRLVVDDVSLSVAPGEVVALVGESGSGKSTLARLLSGLLRPDAGEVLVDGQPLARAGTAVQMVFQDPFASLNPAHTVEHHLLRPLSLRRSRAGIALRRRRAALALRAEAGRLLDSVGLPPQLISRHPHALSGGQRQRVAIARALAAEPRVILADEPTSMLDVSTRLGILTLLRRLADERGLAVLFITHDLSSASAIAARLFTLYAGRVVESGPTAQLLRAPAHPYTRLVLQAAPRGERLTPNTSPPTHINNDMQLLGCAFAPRCPHVLNLCRYTAPRDRPVADADHHVRCHLYAEGASDHAALS